MYVTKEQMNPYLCNLGDTFFKSFLKETNHNENDLINTNELLEFLYDYKEVNDKGKQFFYLLCIKTQGDLTADLIKKYNKLFAFKEVGNDIYNSYVVEYSNYIVNCNDIKFSFGCYNCKFSHHLLYSMNQRHKSYVVFNKQVDKKRYLELIKLSPSEIKNEPEFDEELFSKCKATLDHIYRIRKPKNDCS